VDFASVFSPLAPNQGTLVAGGWIAWHCERTGNKKPTRAKSKNFQLSELDHLKILFRGYKPFTVHCSCKPMRKRLEEVAVAVNSYESCGSIVTIRRPWL